MKPCIAPPSAISPPRSVILVRKVEAERFYTLIYLTMVGIGLKLVLDGLGVFH